MDILAIDEAAGDAQAKYSPMGLTPCEIPAGLGWGSSLIPGLQIWLPGQPGMPGEVSITPEAAFDQVSTARSAPTNTFYVNKNTGSDANPGTEAQPFWSMNQAVTAASSATGTSRVLVAAGTYPRTQMPCYTGYVTKEIAWIAVGGRVITGSFDAFTPAVDGTYTNCYSVALANVGRVVDLASHNRWGNHVEFAYVPTAAACNATPNSWALVSGTLYINRADKAVVTSNNTRAYRSSGNSPIQANTPLSMYFGGASPGDGFDFEGSPNEILSVAPTASSTTAKVIAARDCTFTYGGAVGVTAARTVHIDAVPGLVYFHGCRFDAGNSDGLNLRNSRSAGRTYVLTVNCGGYDNGRAGGNSCNGWTLHDDVYGIEVAGDYGGNHGGSVASVNTSRDLIAGTRIRDDYGDLVLSTAGTLPPTAFYVRDTAEYWLDRVVADMPAGTRSFANMSSTSKIHRRNCPPSRGSLVVSAGTNDTY